MHGNDADPRWGGYCDGHGATTVDELTCRTFVENAVLRAEVEWLREALERAEARADGYASLDVFRAIEAREEALTAEVERLTEALRGVVVICEQCCCTYWGSCGCSEQAQSCAAEALEPKETKR